MITVSFYLDKPRKNQTSLILAASFLGKRIRISTGIKVNSKSWDIKKGCAKKAHTEASAVNSLLNQIRAKVEKKFYELMAAENMMTPLDCKEIIYNITKKTGKSKGRSIFDHYNDFIEERRNDTRFKPETIRAYSPTMNHLIKYEKEKKHKLHFISFDDEFHHKFTSYLIEKGLTNNSIGRCVKILKTFLNWSYKKKLHQNVAFMNYKIWRVEATTVALNRKELEMLEKIDLSKDNRLSKTRDLFLILCYTGIRYSDLQNLSPENIKIQEKIIELVTVKTGERIMIPISNKLYSLLKRYPNFKLPKISNQKFNIYIKQLGETSGINEQIKTTVFAGKVRKEEIKPKYLLMSTHTGRRTFITENLRRKVLPEHIMKVSGHKDRKNFQKYVRISQDEAAEAIRKVWE